PFCVRRCSYCDFAIAVRRDVPSRRYADLVLLEWERWADHRAWISSPEIDTIYFGGGTPSLLDADQLGRILETIQTGRSLSSHPEITLEANPENVTADSAARWLGLGITRVSLGSQSFDPAVLEWMHRTHDAGAIGRAVRLLRDA